MTESKSELNLIQKLNEASKHIGPISKDGSNSYQNYSFQSETAIKYAVEGAIRDAGIRIIPSYEVINQYDKEGRKGGSNHYVDVMGTFLITDGIEKQEGTMPGSGQDSGEKAMAKACTSAQKYFYKQLFNITDKDEDPDGDDSKSSTGAPTRRKQSRGNSNGVKQTQPQLPTTNQQSQLKNLYEAMSGVTGQNQDVISQSFNKVARKYKHDVTTHDGVAWLIDQVSKKLDELVEKGGKSA